jgi:hypothetical protein
MIRFITNHAIRHVEALDPLNKVSNWQNSRQIHFVLREHNFFAILEQRISSKMAKPLRKYIQNESGQAGKSVLDIGWL